MGRNKITTEKNHICGTFWTDAVVPDKLILFLIFLAFKEFFLFYHENVYSVYSLEGPH